MNSMTPRGSARQTFRDRREAGRLLATLLSNVAGERNAVVLALPRGGVPVGFEVSQALGVALDVFTVRKLGVPGHEELAMGAIASGGAYILNEETIAAFGISRDEIVGVVQREHRELERREQLYRDHRPYPVLHGKTVILVDDGLATGASMLVAVDVLRRKHPGLIVVAAPVGSLEARSVLRGHADAVVCYHTPAHFAAVGAWYDDFTQVSDGEVRRLLNLASAGHAS
jgi:putative phosphoribosyl transferase